MYEIGLQFNLSEAQPAPLSWITRRVTISNGVKFIFRHGRVAALTMLEPRGRASRRIAWRTDRDRRKRGKNASESGVFRVSSLHAPPISFHSISRIRASDRSSPSTVVDPFIFNFHSARHFHHHGNATIFYSISLLFFLFFSFSFFHVSFLLLGSKRIERTNDPRYKVSRLRQKFSIDDETKPISLFAFFC